MQGKLRTYLGNSGAEVVEAPAIRTRSLAAEDTESAQAVLDWAEALGACVESHRRDLRRAVARKQPVPDGPAPQRVGERLPGNDPDHLGDVLLTTPLIRSVRRDRRIASTAASRAFSPSSTGASAWTTCSSC